MAKPEIIGMTTMVPVECILSAGFVPMDLNNSFINHKDPASLIEKAEDDGLPRNLCSWVKGIYGYLMNNPVKKVIIPVLGDCSNCVTLGELLEYKGIDVYYFSYNHKQDRSLLKREISLLAEYLGTDFEASKNIYNDLIPIRKKLKTLDERAYKNKNIPSDVLFYFLVSSSDFNSDINLFSQKLDDALKGKYDTSPSLTTIGLTGVPPIVLDLPSTVERLGTRITYFETPRQFSLPYFDDFVDAYILYTYPYSLKNRLDDIKYESSKRKINGLVHYIQSFCHRQIENVIIKKEIDLPILMLEGESPEKTNAQQLMRLEAFLSILSNK